MQAFKNEYIWIIGGTSGIGQAVAKKLIHKGAVVAVSGASTENTEKQAKAMNVVAAPCDISDLAAVQKAQQTLLENWPKIDRIICFASLYDPMKMAELDMPKVHKILDVNLKGMFNLVDTTLKYFKPQQKGQLVITASISGYTGLPNSQPYAATKAGVINMMESLHAESKKSYPHVDIKMINPGFVDTKLTQKNDFKMPFILEPEEAANAIIKGLNKGAFEIHFPRRLTYPLKVLSVLPYWLKQRLVAKLDK